MSSHNTSENAILQYTLLAKNAKGKAAAQLVLQAIRNPNTFLFGELLHMSNIAELATHEDTRREHALLQLFAYGTYQDYKNNKDTFDSVISTEQDGSNSALIHKLKQLTVISLSARQRILPYALLLRELDLANVRELEDLLIDCMYQQLVKGKMDQKEKYFEVYESIGRDIRIDNIDGMIHMLKQWSEHCDSVLRNLEQNTQHALSVFEAQKQHNKEFNKRQGDIARNLKHFADMSDIDMAPHGADEFEESRVSMRRSAAARGKRPR